MIVGAGRVLAAAATALVVASACADRDPGPAADPDLGDPARGRSLAQSYGCGSCHSIPGVRGADSLVGPPLVAFGRRSFIAGTLTNSGPNLARWIADPQGVRPGTAMPDLDVGPEDAADIAAYLLSLR